jgi:SAM-dependent methyltransferase
MVTLDYYNENAAQFTEATFTVEFSAIQDRFLALMPEGGLILDFGCGSGRDTKYFLGKGYCVDAIDGSEELCKIASKNTGIEVRQCLFEDFEAEAKYDGIWACSSILHLPKETLRSVMKAMIRAVKSGGYIYTSFKYGTFEGVRSGRYFTYFTEENFQEFLKDIYGVEITDLWIAADVRPDRGDEKWLNSILQKTDTI